VLITLYNEREIYSFSNRIGLFYVTGLGNIDTGKFSINSEEVEIGSRIFRTRRSTLDDVSSSIERGPQIVVPKDVSYIGFEIDLPLCSKMLEIGGGSGSFSILASLMFRTQIVSYELDPEYYKLMRKNTRRFEAEEMIEVLNKDGMDADVNNFECIFIDNPEPWKFLNRDLDGTKKVASILPTYSQTEEFSRFLVKKGFLVNVHELIDIPIKLSTIGMRPETSFLYHTGFIVSGKGVDLNG
jgi:tRNA A58 N-methylase Trm61